MIVSHTMYDVIAILSLLNFARVLIMLIGADVYDIQQVMRQRRAGVVAGRAKKPRAYRPEVSVIIPAYNEETGVVRTLDSVLKNTYKKTQVIVVNDGSQDRTKQVLRNYQRRHPGAFIAVNQANGGKATAINRAVRYWATGKLVMVVDADSLLHPDAITNMVAHFRDRRVIASAANVKVLPSKSMLGVAQRFEYLISYRMKRALTVFNMEYIVGGVGSTFRRSMLLKVGMYDTDTMTEDIDLTVKLIREYGNKKYHVNYAADSVAYTEHVLKFKSLIKQRFRWKYGRFQTLLKNTAMFFSNNKKYDKRLTWYQLPYAIVGELVLMLEPFLVGYILYVVVRYSDMTSLISVYIIVTTFVFLMVLGEESESLRSKIGLTLLLPFVYIMMYFLTAVEFAALIKSIGQAPQLFRQEMTEGKWEHVERSSEAVSIASIT